MLHGSGPGASSMGNWRSVLPALCERYQVFAMDLLGFGKSDRRAVPPYFDFAMWVRQAEAMLARIEQDKVGVIGHSLSGALALTLAVDQPRIAAVLTTGTMGKAFKPNQATARTWRCPTNREELVSTLKGLIHDHSVIDEAYLSAREPVIFAAGYADYFNRMFEGDPARYVEAAILGDDLLARVQCPVALLHGRDDIAFPPSSSIHIAGSLPRADLTLLRQCSHSVAFERRETFLALATDLFDAVFQPH
nr:alpha/beta fold hydrolase [Alloalcanivorax marinus]